MIYFALAALFALSIGSLVLFAHLIREQRFMLERTIEAQREQTIRVIEALGRTVPADILRPGRLEVPAQEAPEPEEEEGIAHPGMDQLRKDGLL